MNTQQVIDRIFKDPSVKFDLSEFEGLGTSVHEMIDIYYKNGTGRQTGKNVYFLKPLAPFHSEKEEIQVYVEGGKSSPEEIVRQLWVYKLINFYNYKPEQIVCEIPVQFGTEVNTKFADIAVYRDASKETVKLLFEIKKPKRKDGIDQLKSYLGAKGNPIGIWSNGTDRLILYKPQNKDFDTLSEIPKVNEEEKDVLEIKRTLPQLKQSFNFKKIIQGLEELVLADSGVDEFNEIFKIIFAKIWDEKEANENRRTRPNKEVEFKKFEDPELTYDTINGLFKSACNDWQGVFEDNENIKLRKDHLQVCIGPVEPVRLMGSNLRIMDDAFEYLLPTEAKKKKGQFFTPRHVIEMCVRMMNPQPDEYVMDPSCGSAGFLLHTMEWAVPATTPDEQELRKHRYASKYLWGIDFEARAAKTSRQSLEAALPWLYLKGVSTGEMSEALKILVGESASGLSASTVSKLKTKWAQEYAAWQQRRLDKDRWVYLWADGIHSGLKGDHGRLCALVVIGVNERGHKHFLAIEDGVRESTQSWREVLLNLKSRGLNETELAIGDGALGFWNALEEMYPATKQQRCWVHKTANVLNKLPKSVQPKAKRDLHNIWQADTRDNARKAFDTFVYTYRDKYPKAIECLEKDHDELMTFYSFPAKHWSSIRTTNPIESSFATIRHRTKRTKGCLSRDGMLSMMFKLGQCAEKKWNRLRGFDYLAKVIQGVPFKDGIEQTINRSNQTEAA